MTTKPGSLPLQMCPKCFELLRGAIKLLGANPSYQQAAIEILARDLCADCKVQLLGAPTDRPVPFWRRHDA